VNRVQFSAVLPREYGGIGRHTRLKICWALPVGVQVSLLLLARRGLFLFQLLVMIDQFISDLKSIPTEEYKKFFDHASLVAKAYALNLGIDCFARGETIEWAFINEFSKFIDIKGAAKKQIDEPDGVYKKVKLFDVKLSKEGLKPQESNPNLIYSHPWDFKKTQTGVDEFVTKADFYLLIDAWSYRVAVLDAEVVKSRDIAKNSSRIAFSVKTKDVTMIYDGINERRNFDMPSLSGGIFKMIWDSVLPYMV
jgi:hypothetical protein